MTTNIATPDINQRDDANEIKTVVGSTLQRFLIRKLRGTILRLIQRRLDREHRIGRINETQLFQLSNTMRRTFLESTDA